MAIDDGARVYVELLLTYPFLTLLLLLTLLYNLSLLPSSWSSHISKQIEPLSNFLKSLAESGNAFADQYNDSYIDAEMKEENKKDA